MYSRDYHNKPSATVRAFEEAYAKEDMLRRSTTFGNCKNAQINSGQESACTENQTQSNEIQLHKSTQSSLQSNTKNNIFSFLQDADLGDIILLFLIVLFLFDNDNENDSIIPIILAVLLLF